MKLGFTGTRERVATCQWTALRQWMERSPFVEFHHGCCEGADETAVDVLASKTPVSPPPRIIGHPPTVTTLVSKFAVEWSDELRQPAPYLARNKNIVNETDMLLACPKGPEEQRSGTWSTVRYARKLGRRIVIIWPDGSVGEDSR